ncbi:MAG: hypothetical protein NTZ16_13510 [Verrucomicrobia bacterium]|nr:hypothetical protein [Verrucomicrobiota bacterium]
MLAAVGVGLMPVLGGAATTNGLGGPALLTGTVYESGSTNRKVLFQFRRTAVTEGDRLRVVREFLLPDGKLAARERTEFAGTNLLAFEMEEFQIKTRTSARLERKPEFGSKIFFENGDLGKPAAQMKRSETPLRPNTLVNDMVSPFLQLHWEELMQGREVKFRYLVAERGEAFGFRFTKEAESVQAGRPVVIFKMAATSRIIGAFVKPLLFTVERDGERRVLQYEGRTMPKIKSWGFWHDLDAVTVFDWEQK